jgi:hypothetical protein
VEANVAWNYTDLSQLTGAPQAFADPTGYAFDGYGTRHVTYAGADQHVHELWWNPSGWRHKDLTVAAGAPSGCSNTAIGYVLFCAQHVIYFGQFLDELWCDNGHNSGWRHVELESAAGVLVPATGRPIGYAFTGRGTQHVNIVDDILSHIHEYWWDNRGWHYHNLTKITGAPTASSSPTGWAFEAQGTRHVTYVGNDQDIHELWWDPAGWHHNDLTSLTGSPKSKINRNTSAYVFATQGTQHVTYVGVDSHIHELWWDAGGWHHHDLTSAAAAPHADEAGSGFVLGGAQYVVFRGVDDHVHELSRDSGGWRHHDLTVITGSSAGGGAPTGFGFAAFGSRHVIYQDAHSNVIELSWTP